jgi:selenocysteine lyase/cysteine desulfurase
MGLRVDVIPDDSSGTTDAAELARMLDDDVRLVCAVHAPSHNGLVNDVTSIGAQLRASGSEAWYLVDACQSLGQLPVDMPSIGCDFLIASGRKYLRGPRGSGMLVVSDRALRDVDAYPVDVAGGRWVHTDDYTLDDSARRFESFESSVAVTLGLIAAARYATELGIPVLTGAIARNAEYLRSHLGAAGAWRVQDRGRIRSGIVTVRHEDVATSSAVEALAAAGVNAWEVGHHTNPRDLGGRSVLRLSPHAYNTRHEMDRALDVLAGLQS